MGDGRVEHGNMEGGALQSLPSELFGFLLRETAWEEPGSVATIIGFRLRIFILSWSIGDVVRLSFPAEERGPPVH